MSQAYEKAIILYNQRRYDLAQPLFLEHLTDRPDDGEALAYLALAYVRTEKVKEAVETAKRAIDAQPDRALPHYAAAVIARKRKRYKDASKFIKDALAIDPDDTDYIAFAGLLHLDKKKFAEALKAAEVGLSLSPDCINCQNVRASALTGLGKGGPSREILEAILQENPHDSMTLANLGWNQLHEHRWKEALDYFSRSLQEDAENEFARDGLLEALRAQNPVYGFLLKYFLWLSRFTESSRWAIIFTETAVRRILEETADRNPALRPFIRFIMNAWAIFSYLTWVGRPLANLWLCLNPYGRRVLKQEEIVESGVVGGFLGQAGLAYLFWRLFRWRVSLAWMIICLTIVLPVSSVFDCPSGRPRNIMAAYTLGLLGVGVYAVWLIHESPLTGGSGFSLYGTGLLLGRYLGMYLARQEKDS